MQLEAALDYVREGDTLVVCRLDRLARSTSHLLSIVERLEAKGVALRILDWAGDVVDTGTPMGRLMLTTCAAFAQFERELIKERARCGIEAAKLAGKYKGRKATARAKTAEVLRLKNGGLGPAAIATQIGISRASVYRILADACQRRSKSRPFGGVKPGHRVTCRGEWREGVARGPLPPALV